MKKAARSGSDGYPPLGRPPPSPAAPTARASTHPACHRAGAPQGRCPPRQAARSPAAIAGGPSARRPATARSSRRNRPFNRPKKHPRRSAASGSNDFDQRLAALHRRDHIRQYRPEPIQQCRPPRVPKPYPNHHRPSARHHPALHKIHVLRDDRGALARAQSQIAPSEAAAIPRSATCSASCSCDASIRASAGGSCASTRNRIRQRATPDDRFAAPHTPARP
jgi:hypothetical protein